jgi:hypothetical protein
MYDEVGYWRKSNQIHGWFVENVQKGVDDCGEYVVSLDQLKALKGLCEAVLEDKDRAGELLPSRQGFFFGSYCYDEMYFSDIADTIEILDKCIENSEDIEFIYQSSW